MDATSRKQRKKRGGGGNERESGQNHVPLESRTLSSPLNLAGTHAVPSGHLTLFLVIG